MTRRRCVDCAPVLIPLCAGAPRPDRAGRWPSKEDGDGRTAARRPDPGPCMPGISPGVVRTQLGGERPTRARWMAPRSPPASAYACRRPGPEHERVRELPRLEAAGRRRSGLVEVLVDPVGAAHVRKERLEACRRGPDRRRTGDPAPRGPRRYFRAVAEKKSHPIASTVDGHLPDRTDSRRRGRGRRRRTAHDAPDRRHVLHQARSWWGIWVTATSLGRRRVR